ncbi:MAG: hypothetical protein MUP41_05165 [Desulfobacterales bacterium]|nr:hypothetical protein [Desulfobacterales bacterium]
MLKIYSEEIKADFEGTIIDLETIGYFDDRYDDSRRYRNIIPVIFGYMNRDRIRILYAEDQGSITDLGAEIISVLGSLKGPFYAFNSDFERGVLFNHLGKKIVFDGELNQEKFESKKRAVQSFGIPNYGDPCNDNGLLCSQYWLKGKIEPAILHNRSCLLKERDILLKRGYRKPDKLRFIK